MEEDNTLMTHYIMYGKLFPPVIMIFHFVFMYFNSAWKNIIKPLLFVQSPERRTTPRQRKIQAPGSSKRRKIEFEETTNRGDGGRASWCLSKGIDVDAMLVVVMGG